MSAQILLLNVDAISDPKVKLVAHLLNEITGFGLWRTRPDYDPRPIYQLELFQEMIGSMRVHGDFILEHLDSEECSRLAKSEVELAASIEKHLASIRQLLDQYARVHNDLATRVYYAKPDE